MNDTLRMILGTVILIVMLYLLIKGVIKTLKWIINLFRINKNEKIDLSNLNTEDLFTNPNKTINQKQTPNTLSSNSKPTNQKSFWSQLVYLFQDHCPKCDSADIKKIGTQEVDRWQSSKKVRERLASGKTKERYVNITYVTLRRHYQCSACGYTYYKDKKEEK